MTHDEVIERLPWLANGALEAAERHAVESHLADCPGCRLELAETVAALRLAAAAHPSSAQLVAHAWSESPTEARAALERHLALCAPCRRELDLAAASRELEDEAAPGGASGPPAAARGAGRLALRAAAGVALLAGALLAFAAWRQAASDRAALERRLASAESALAVAGEERARSAAGDEQRMARLEQRLAELDGPRAGLPVIELVPEGVLRGEGAPRAPRLSAGAAPFATLLLALERPAPGATYRLRLLGPDGAELLALAGIAPDGRGALTLLLPTASLPAGRLTLEVAAERGGAPALRYGIELTREP